MDILGQSTSDFENKVEATESLSRSERSEIRLLLIEMRRENRELRGEMRGSIGELRGELRRELGKMSNKLDLVIFDLESLNRRVKQWEDWSVKAWLADIGVAVFKRRPTLKRQY